VDCLIAGAAISGMLTARELAVAGLDVVIGRGRGARDPSWARVGILSPLYPWRYPDAVSQPARRGQGCYAQLARSLLKEDRTDAATIERCVDTRNRVGRRSWRLDETFECCPTAVDGRACRDKARCSVIVRRRYGLPVSVTPKSAIGYGAARCLETEGVSASLNNVA
jgi:glycine/D-amino acid oxidase-like deaminating enzyme